MKATRFTKALICMTLAGLLCVPALGFAKEIELKISSAFDLNRNTELGLRMFIERINDLGAGKVKLNYVGGPSAIPPFELIEALRNGTVDLAASPGSYYSPQVPEAGAMYLSRISAWDERENGAYALFNEVIQKKANAYYLGRYNTTYKFNFYTQKKVEKITDFKGLKIRVSPVYKAFLNRLGGVPIAMPHSEIYTALERGVVDGMGGTNFDIMDKGWHEHLKYIIDPSFYGSDTTILVNLDVWKKLPEDVRLLMESVILKVERDSGLKLLEIIRQERQDLMKAGLQVITIASPEAYVDMAYDAAWEDILKKSPEFGQTLRQLLSKK